MPQQEDSSRRPELATTEILHPSTEIGIYNETDRLRSAVVWGPVGAEAVLAQLYPKEISCFYEDMNVIKARQEALDFAATLQSYEVKTTSVRDTIADMLPSQHLQKQAVLESLLTKAQQLKDQYPQVTLERGSEQMYGKEFGKLDSTQIRAVKNKVPMLEKDVDDAIRTLLDMDILRYGEQKALALNKRLCLDEEMPLGDAIYARDQMNVLLGMRVKSRMKYPIRQPEVPLYEEVYKVLLGEDSPVIEIPEGETFEGGDAYIHNNIVYVGVGYRTSLGAAKHIYSMLRPQIEERGMQFAIVQDEDPDLRSGKDLMDFMHLDTFSGPIGDNQIAVCKEEAEYRRVKYLKTDSQGIVQVLDTGKNFLQHLQERDGDDNVVIIPREEQQEFGCNFLALDEHTLLLPLDSNEATNRQLYDAGKELVSLGLQESTRGYGASHCMTGQLVRAR